MVNWKKTHVLESIWIPEFSTLWRTKLHLGSRKIVSNLIVSNAVEIRLQLLGEYVEEELTKSADYENENAHSSINRSSHSNFPVAQFQNISSCWPMNFFMKFFDEDCWILLWIHCSSYFDSYILEVSKSLECAIGI